MDKIAVVWYFSTILNPISGAAGVASQKVKISLNLNYKVNFKDFLSLTVCVSHT